MVTQQHATKPVGLLHAKLCQPRMTSSQFRCHLHGFVADISESHNAPAETQALVGRLPGSRVPEATETGVSSGNYRSLPGYWSPGTARDEDNKSITTTGTLASVNVIETHNNTSQCGHINDSIWISVKIEIKYSREKEMHTVEPHRERFMLQNILLFSIKLKYQSFGWIRQNHCSTDSQSGSLYFNRAHCTYVIITTIACSKEHK